MTVEDVFLGVFHRRWSIISWQPPHYRSDREGFSNYTMLGGVVQAHEESNPKQN